MFYKHIQFLRLRFQLLYLERQRVISEEARHFQIHCLYLFSGRVSLTRRLILVLVYVLVSSPPGSRDGMTSRGSAPAAAGRNYFPAGRPARYHNGSDLVAIQVSSNQLRLGYCDLTQWTWSWLQRRAPAIRRHGPGAQGPGTRPASSKYYGSDPGPF